MTIPFNQIRRFGCQVAIDKDIVWFETCGCGEETEEFQFVIIALGIEKAYQIVQEYKRSIELALRVHMILEEGDESRYLYSYVVKSHYGHSDFPTMQRERILQSSLMSLSTSGSGGALSLSELNKFARSSRPSLPAIHASGPTLGAPIPGDPVRKVSVGSPTANSPTHPYGQQPSGKGKTTLEQLQRSPRSSRSSFQSTSSEFDSGVSVNELDPSRHSAPCYLPATSSPKLGLNQTGKGASFDETKQRKTSFQSNGKPRTLKEIGSSKGAEQHGDGKRVNMSLGEYQLKGGIQAYNNSRRGTDSGMGSACDLPQSSGSSPYSLASPESGASGNRGGYDQLSGRRSPYDHLTEKVNGLHVGSGKSRGRSNDPYADM